MTIMDWLAIVAAVISGSVAAGGAIWSIRALRDDVRELRHQMHDLLMLLASKDKDSH